MTAAGRAALVSAVAYLLAAIRGVIALIRYITGPARMP